MEQSQAYTLLSEMHNWNEFVYSKVSKLKLTNYVNACSLSNFHKNRSQIDYLFTCSGTTISWRFVKQPITTTSSNQAKCLALHEESKNVFG